jgi:hypothetical protein
MAIVTNIANFLAGNFSISKKILMEKQRTEREEDNLAVSPMSKIVKKIPVQKKTLQESQIPSFISRLTDAIQEPIPFVANPIQVTKKTGRP